MAYERQNWKTGEVITADKLNHMEEGIAIGGILFQTIEEEDLNDDFEFNVTGRYLLNLFENGATIYFFIRNSPDNGEIRRYSLSAVYRTDAYEFAFWCNSDMKFLYCYDLDDRVKPMV